MVDIPLPIEDKDVDETNKRVITKTSKTIQEHSTISVVIIGL